MTVAIEPEPGINAGRFASSRHVLLGVVLSSLLLLLLLILVMISLSFNPHVLQSIDRLLILAPCCPPGKMSINLSDTMIWSIMKFASYSWTALYGDGETRLFSLGRGDENCCQSCKRYREIRCQFRVEEVELYPTSIWVLDSKHMNKATFRNVTIRSCPSEIVNTPTQIQMQRMQVQAQTKMQSMSKLETGYTDMNSACTSHASLSSLLPLHIVKLFQRDTSRRSTKLRFDCVKFVVDSNLSIEGNANDDSNSNANDTRNNALEAKELSFHWDSISQPIVDIQVINITIHILYGTVDSRMLVPLPGLERGSFQIPVQVPSVKLGNWTVPDLLSMMPDPPDEKGSYPRLGLLDVANVTLHLLRRDHNYGVNENDIHGNNANREGRDEMKEEYNISIPNELFSPLHAMTKGGGPDGVDRTEVENLLREATTVAVQKLILGEDVLETVHKSAELIVTWRYLLEDFIRDGGGGLKVLVDAIRDFLQKWEDEWKDLVDIHISESKRQAQDTISKLTNEWKEGWEEVIQNVDLVKQDVNQVWKIAKEHIDNFESNVGGFMQQFEQLVENKWDQVHRDHSGLKKGWKKFIEGDRFNDLEAKFHQFELGVEQIVKEAKVDLEFDLDFAKERAQEANNLIRNGWESARNYLKPVQKEGKVKPGKKECKNRRSEL